MKKLIVMLMTVVLLMSSAWAESATGALQELYAQAELLMVQGDYTGAAAKFEAMGTYSDASQMAMYCKAIAAAESLGLYSMAVDAFNDLGTFKDSPQMAKYYQGRAYEAAGVIDPATASDAALDKALWHLQEAEKVYGGLAFFKDSLTRMAACGERIKAIESEQSQRAAAAKEATYQSALALEQSGDYAGAIRLYQSIKGYKDSTARIQLCQTAILDGKYDAALALMNEGKYSEAIEAFKAIKTHRDSAEKITECEIAILDGKYDAALALMDAGKYSEAIEAFTAIKTHRDSAEKIKECETAILDGKYDAAVALMDAGKYSEAYDAFVALNVHKDSAEQANSISDKAKAEKLAKATVGSYVIFGTYEQDNNTANGKEDIDWLVLDKENNRLLVISRYALARKNYHESYSDVTWKSCALRTWLNKDFLNEAFTHSEQAMIPTVTVRDDKNPSWSSPGTQDKVFLLSSVEADRYFATDSTRQCKPTAFANASVNGSVSDWRTCWWRLRTPGNRKYSVALVGPDGSISNSGGSIISADATRPALWIDLASNANHNVTPTPSPTNTPTPKSVIITADSAKIRTEASISAGLVKTAYKGEYFTLLGESGDFYKISISGKTGYVHKDVSGIQ